MPNLLEQHATARKVLETVATGVPLLSYFTNLAPPYPVEGVGPGMGVVAVIVWIIVFVFLAPRGQNFARKAVLWSIVGLVPLGILYFVLLTYYTVPAPTGKPVVKGYTHTELAKKYLSVSPNDTDRDLLEKKEYKVEQVWTPSSITRVKLTLVTMWFLSFICYAMMIFLFEVWFSRRAAAAATRAENKAKKQDGTEPD